MGQGQRERATTFIQACVRGYLQRCYLKRMKRKAWPSSFAHEFAATVIQKCYRGFIVRKAFQLYRQRLNTQILCFLQQIELISNDFFTKIVKTNYCVPFKSVDTRSTQITQQNKYAHKISQYLFPPPPPPHPMPSPSPFTIFSPPLPPPDPPTAFRTPAITSSIPLPPPPPALFLSSRPSPQSRHPLISASHGQRSPSPSASSVPKFAQVRDMFARAEAAVVGAHHHHLNHHHPPPPPFHHHQHVPMKPHPPSTAMSSASNSLSQHLPPIESTRSPRSLTVLDAVLEYQRQHIKANQPAHKRFSHLGGGGAPVGLHNRVSNASGNIGVKARVVAPPNVNNIKSHVVNKPAVVPTSFISSSPKQQHQPPKPITRVRATKPMHISLA